MADDDVAYLKVRKIKQWMEKTKDREQWRIVVEEAKAYPGLQRREDGWNRFPISLVCVFTKIASTP
jgi:hypothetical protein